MEKVGNLLTRQIVIASFVLILILSAGSFVGYQLIKAEDNIVTNIERTREAQALMGSEPEELRQLRKQNETYGPYIGVISQLLPSKESFLDIKDTIVLIGRNTNITADPRLQAETANGIELLIRTRGVLSNTLDFITKMASVFVVQFNSMTIQSDNIAKTLSTEGQMVITLFTKR